MSFLINPYRFSSPETDPHFANVVALLHFNGADGSTTFTDVKGNTFTGAGNAQIDTAESKFGGASLLVDGAGDYVSAPSSADWRLGAGDFTIEAWVRFAAVGSGICGFYNTTGNQRSWRVLVASAASVQFVYSTNGTNGTAVTFSTSTMSTGVWYHLALVRSGSVLKLFLDGVQQDTDKAFSSTLFAATAPLTIGSSLATSEYLNGWVEDFRLTKGFGRYTSNFTPRSAAFPDV